MSQHNMTREIAVRNEAGELELIDLHTGEVISNSALPEQLGHEYAFSYPVALAICQEVKQGRTLSDIARDPKFPPLHVISHWQRTDRMFAEELILARRSRAEYYHDKVIEIANNAAEMRYSKDDVPAAKLAADTFKWAAERGDPSKFGNKVTHEGSEEKPILMRVINTGIRRNKPDVIVASKEESNDVSRQEREEQINKTSES
jgi:hypothetical protein